MRLVGEGCWWSGVGTDRGFPTKQRGAETGEGVSLVVAVWLPAMRLVVVVAVSPGLTPQTPQGSGLAPRYPTGVWCFTRPYPFASPSG